MNPAFCGARRLERQLAPTLREAYPIPEAQAAIESLLAEGGEGCTLRLLPEGIQIRDSYRLHDRRRRLAVCMILSRTELTARSGRELSAEWLFHNLAYRLHVKRESARHVDLDPVADPRAAVRAATRLLELLGLC